MNSGLLQALKSFVALSWDFFTEITIPGTTFTFAALFVGLFLADLGLRFLFMVLGVSVNPGEVFRLPDKVSSHGKSSRKEK